jgi:transcriptional regulator with XRE-family HTH domain
MTDETGTMGQRLRQLRQDHGQTVRGAAEAIGCAFNHLSMLERGTAANPSLLMLQGIARHYSVSVAYLIGEDGIKNRWADRAIYVDDMSELP